MSTTHRPRSYALLLAGFLAIAAMVPLALGGIRTAAAYPPAFDFIDLNGDSGPPDPYYNTSVFVEAQATELNPAVIFTDICIFDLNVTTSAQNADCTAMGSFGTVFVDLLITGDGEHEVTIRTCSIIAVMLCLEATREFTIDTTPPVVTFTANQQHYTGPAYVFGTWSKYNVFVNWVCSEDTGDVLFDTGIATNTYPATIGFIVDGQYSVPTPYWNPVPTCVDLAGNVAATPANKTVKTDQTNPACAVKATPNRVNRTGSTNVVISATESDRTSGVASVVLKSIKVNGPGLDTQPGPGTGPQHFSYVSGSNIGGSLNGSSTGTFSFSGAKLRSWTVEVEATDNAGNVQLCKTKVTTR